MKPISFLSDFGSDDEFVGVVHGVIARVEPQLRVIDVTHGVPGGDIRAGALALLRAIQYLPEGVALAVVDPGVGTKRRAIAAETPWGYFVGPDNGLLAPAVAMVGGAEVVVSLEDERFQVPSLGGSTFDGRDVFAPAAAVLASGQANIKDLGPVLPSETITPLLLPLVETIDGGLRGEIWWIDKFGNAESNISPADLEALGHKPGDQVRIVVGSMEHHLSWVAAYGDVEPGVALLHTDSYGLISIAIREGNAAEDLSLAAGIPLEIKTPV